MFRQRAHLYAVALLAFVGIANGCGGSEASPKQSAAIPPGLIAFGHQQASGRDEIDLVEPDGSGERVLTSARINGYEPVWSPNGEEIAYVAGEGDWLYVMSADGSGRHLVSRGAGPLGGAARPSWSPDSARLLFAADTVPGHALYVVNADGTGLRRLSSRNVFDPAWSPRGGAIAVTLAVKAHHQEQIAVLDAAGGRLRVLTHSRDCADWPTWSPDGTRIAYTLLTGPCFSSPRSSAIHVMNADGGQDSALTHPGENVYDQSPAWSPNGNAIAFQRGDPFFGAISVVDVDDGSLRHVAGAPGDKDFDPSWQPLMHP